MRIHLPLYAVAFCMAASFMAHEAAAATSGNLFPISDGPANAWTPNAGSVRYTTVDESSCNGNTDFVATNTVAARQSFGLNLANIPDGSVITAIAVTPCLSRNLSGTGTTAIKVFYVHNGVNSADGGNYLPTGTTPTNQSATTFSGLSITRLSTTTIGAGVVYSSGDRGAKVSRLATIITYTPPTPPAAPTNLVATNVSGTQNNLTWTDVATTETSYRVERSVNGGAYTHLATTSANATSYNDTTASADQTYRYQVRAHIGNNASAYALSNNVITATVVPNAVGTTTSNLIASSTGISLFWNHVNTNESSYSIERSTDGVNFAEVGTTTLNVTSFAQTGLPSGTYYYRVRALNAIGYGAYGNTTFKTIP